MRVAIVLAGILLMVWPAAAQGGPQGGMTLPEAVAHCESQHPDQALTDCLSEHT